MNSNSFAGVWSAAPTPFTDDMTIDLPSLKRSVAHHLRLGIRGLFLAGTCGEGPCLTDRQRLTLFEKTAEYSDGKLILASQVTDNSAARVLDRIKEAKKAGMDVAVMAPPYFFMNSQPERLLSLYVDIIQNSSLPMAIYDRGKHSSVFVPDTVLKRIYAEPNVVLIKDSSSDFERMRIAISAKRKRPKLSLFNGWEFNCIPYLKAGYDGLLLGGGIFNGFLAAQIMEAVRVGNIPKAERMQLRMNRMMHAVFGGKTNPSWLSGQKKLLVKMGIFSTWKSYLQYPLTKSCCLAIDRVMQKDSDILMPWRNHNG
jgi:4-hydroxy-tetrahydrodipicolinate synthase